MVYRMKMSIVCVGMGVVMGVFSTSLRAGEEAQVGDATQDAPTKGLSGEAKIAVEAVPETAATSLDALVSQMSRAKAKIAPHPKSLPYWKRKEKSVKARALKEYESQLEVWRKQDKPNMLGKTVTWTLTCMHRTGSRKKGISLRLVSGQGNVALSEQLRLTQKEYSSIKEGKRIEIKAEIEAYEEPTSPAAGATVQLKNTKITNYDPPASQPAQGPTVTVCGVRIPAKNVIYLLSKRGSLIEVSYGVSRQVIQSVESLSSTQRYQIQCFAERVQRMRTGYTAATDANKAAAKEFLNRMVAEGQGGDGLERVLSRVANYRTPETVIVLLSHGQSDNPKKVLALAKRMRIPIYAFDLNAAQSDDSSLLLNIAELTNGKYVPMMKLLP
jgi:hypothetical protein